MFAGVFFFNNISNERNSVSFIFLPSDDVPVDTYV